MTEQKLNEIKTEELDDFILSFHSRLDFYAKLGDSERVDHAEARALKNEARRKLIELEKKNLNGAIPKMYGSSFKEAVNLAMMLEAYGRNRNWFLDASRRVWGEPSYSTYRAALDVLSSDPSSGEIAQELKQSDKSFSSAEMRKWMEIVVEQLNLDWKINVYEGSGGMAVSSANQTLNMPSERQFSKLEMFRLPLHELGRHAECYVNGLQQPYRVMAVGVGGYEETDEGTAVELERTAGLMDADVLKKYAARAAAVYMMNQDTARDEVKHALSEYEVQYSTVDRVVDRVYQGGGFSRDHIYFEGFREVQGYLGSDGSLSDLFIGKVPVEALKAGLAERDEIKDPRHPPEEFFSKFYEEMRPAWNRFREQIA